MKYFMNPVMRKGDCLVYADSDFFLALIKENDWLKKKAEKLLSTEKIWTSQWAVVEILLLSKEYRLDPEKVVISISKIADIHGDLPALLGAAHLIKDKGMTVFDALHAVSCKNDTIISSDRVFEEIGLKRIKLEA